MKFKDILYFIAFLLIGYSANAQELIANVIIDHELIQNTEKSIFIDMKSNIQQFINTRKWTNDRYGPTEKIKMNLNIKLQDQPSIGQFKGVVQIQFIRPVYGVGYETSTINYLDKDFVIQYTLSQPMEFNDNSYTTNLTSLIAFYIYIGLGMEYDSFSKLGGSSYFEKAQLVLNTAQNNGDQGWKQFGNNPNNRYWLNENINNPIFKEFREATYTYYRLALDELAAKPEEARTKIIEVLTTIKRAHDAKPNSALLRTFFNTKGDEIIKIMSEASPAEKGTALELLRIMDPTNTDNYEKMMK